MQIRYRIKCKLQSASIRARFHAGPSQRFVRHASSPRFYSPLPSVHLFFIGPFTSYGSSSSISRQWPIQYPNARRMEWRLSDNGRRAEERVNRGRSETRRGVALVPLEGEGGWVSRKNGKIKPAARLLFSGRGRERGWSRKTAKKVWGVGAGSWSD